jgi:uncharacterized protein (TIGR02001 family)
MLGVCVLGAPAVVQANEVSLSFGATVTTEYVSSGVRYSDGLAAQPYVELGFGGFYAGAYASNLDADLTSADREYGLSLGYRGETGRFSYDVGVAYYIYDEAFADTPVEDSAEVYASGTFAVSDRLYLTAELAISPEYDQTDRSLRADYFTGVEGLSIGGTVGQVASNYGDWSYWSLDAAYAVTEAVSLGVAYHDTNLDPDLGLADTAGLFVTSITLSF